MLRLHTSFLALSATLCLSTVKPVAAQTPPTLNVTVAGLGCSTVKGANQFTVLSFSWGASTPVTAGIGRVSQGRPTISSFNIMKVFDGCSPALFGGSVEGTHFATLTLVQTNPQNVPLMTVTLSEAQVESIQWSGSDGGGPTTESVAFAFTKVCLQDVASSAKLCYDAATGKTQ